MRTEMWLLVRLVDRIESGGSTEQRSLATAGEGNERALRAGVAIMNEPTVTVGPVAPDLPGALPPATVVALPTWRRAPGPASGRVDLASPAALPAIRNARGSCCRSDWPLATATPLRAAAACGNEESGSAE
jgi:hypothetical protein